MFWLIIPGIALVVVIIVLARAAAFSVPKPEKLPAPESAPLPGNAVERLSKSITFRTISYHDESQTDYAPFDQYIAFLHEEYPLFHQNTTLTRINGYGLVYEWQGRRTDLPPMLFMAHYDVVPIESGTEEQWKYPGFSGAVAEGRVWGRGTLDIKSQMLAHMEAVQDLMKEGFVPERSFIFAYGHDEEVSGLRGALRIVEYLKDRGVRPVGVLDEGSFAVKGVIPGSDTVYALIGVAEKGYCDYEVTMKGPGGHSSMPPKRSPAGYLGELLYRLENTPMPYHRDELFMLTTRNMFGGAGFYLRVILSNLWLFRPLFLKIMDVAPQMAAMVRTTLAPTLIEGGNANNALPQSVKAVVNARIIPGDTVADVAAHIQNLAHHKSSVEISLKTPREPSPVSPAKGLVYRNLEAQIRHFFPGAVVTPSLVVAGTDAYKYHDICENVYRFTPLLVSSDERSCVHGTDESVSIENYGRMIEFFSRMFRDFDNM